MEDDFFSPVILDCDFCEKAQHFNDNHAAVDEGWNWIDIDYEDGTRVTTAACPEHDAEKVTELADRKKDNITYKERIDKNQETFDEVAVDE